MDKSFKDNKPANQNNFTAQTLMQEQMDETVQRLDIYLARLEKTALPTLRIEARMESLEKTMLRIEDKIEAITRFQEEIIS